MRAFSHQQARLVVLAAGVAFVLALIGTSRLRPDASLSDMMASDSPAARALVDLSRRFPVADELVVIATVPPPSNDALQSLTGFAERLQRMVRNSRRLRGMVRSVQYHRLTGEERALRDEVVIPNALYYLSDQQFACLSDRLSTGSIEDAIRRNERLVSAPGAAGEVLVQRISHDPLNLAACVEADGWPAFTEVEAPSNDAQLMLSRDRRSLAIRLGATQPAGDDLDFTRRLVDEVTASAREANLEDLRLEFTGAYAIASFAERSIRRDMIVSIGTSVPCILLLFLLAYRRLSFLVLTLLPVALGIVSGFGAFSLFSTSLTPMTAVIGAVIAGLGVDFAIHYVTRARQLAGTAIARDAAAACASRELMRPLSLAAATSIAAFIAVATSTVPAVRDFGLVGMFGLAGALLTALFVLPALIHLFPGLLPETAPRSRSGRDILPPLPQGEGRGEGEIGSMLAAAVHRYHRPILVVSLLLVLLCAGGLLLFPARLVPTFSSDPDLLHPQPNPPLQRARTMAERFDAPVDAWPVLVSAASPGELLIRTHEVRRTIEAVKGLAIRQTRSIATILPDPGKSEVRAAQIEAIDADRILADLDRALADSIFEPAAFASFRAKLREVLRPGPAPGLPDLSRYPVLASQLVSLPARGEQRFPHYALLTIDWDEPPAISEHGSRIQALQSALKDTGATLTGMSVVGHQTQFLILKNLVRAFALSVAGIIIFLLLAYRRVTDVICVICPTAVGLLFLLMFVHLRGDELNLVNLVGLPLLIGLGIDDGILLLSTWKRHPRQVRDAGSTCTAIILTSATTALGFGSLILTGTPAIRSLGLLTTVGIVACLFATLFLLLPLLFLRTERQP